MLGHRGVVGGRFSNRWPSYRKWLIYVILLQLAHIYTRKQIYDNHNHFWNPPMEKEYICGCGKAYGSYPAFSTHRKLKHANQNVSGTNIPNQEKARRGRPSYDFKKIPVPAEQDKKYYQGLTIIELGLLSLEEQLKGKIIGNPHTDITLVLPDVNGSLSDTNQARIQSIHEFLHLFTRHMSQSVANSTAKFINNLINFGLKTDSLTNMNVYNNFFIQSSAEMKKCQLGLRFYAQICIIMSKWLRVMGVAEGCLSVCSESKIVS